MHLMATYEHNKFNFESLGMNPKKYWRTKDREDKINIINGLLTSEFSNSTPQNNFNESISKESKGLKFQKSTTNANSIDDAPSKSENIKSIFMSTKESVGFSKVNDIYSRKSSGNIKFSGKSPTSIGIQGSKMKYNRNKIKRNTKRYIFNSR